MRVQIEEKEFEVAFMSEFEKTPGQYGHSIGQALEGIWGFEAILYSDQDPLFIRARTNRARGRLMKEIAGFTTVRANLFIQFKRSENCTSKISKPYQHWKSSYYEYRTTSDQQKLLEDFSQGTNSTAVIYAAPVFHLRKDLVQHKQASSVIANSNVIHVNHLSGHKRFTFTNSTNGMGFSEPESISTLNLKELTESLLEKDYNKDFVENLLVLSSEITSVCKKNKLGDYLENMSSLRYQAIGENNDREVTENTKYLQALSKITTFLEMTNTRWSILL
jgi:hypothetical protein